MQKHLNKKQKKAVFKALGRERSMCSHFAYSAVLARLVRCTATAAFSGTIEASYESGETNG